MPKSCHPRGTGLGNVTARLLSAMNGHDLDAFVACFAEDYRSEQPAHPSLNFSGRDKVRDNWAGVFSGVPDFQAELLSHAIPYEGVEMSEWRWSGRHVDGSAFAMEGVIVFGNRRRPNCLGPALYGGRR